MACNINHRTAFACTAPPLHAGSHIWNLKWKGSIPCDKYGCGRWKTHRLKGFWCVCWIGLQQSDLVNAERHDAKQDISIYNTPRETSELNALPSRPVPASVPCSSSCKQHFQQIKIKLHSCRLRESKTGGDNKRMSKSCTQTKWV